jgi:hypothetical protein
MKIKFNIDDPLALTHWPPILAKDFLPEWYAKLPEVKESYAFNEIVTKNVRACVPVSDLMSSGYIIRATFEVRVSEKIINFAPAMSIQTALEVKDGNANSNTAQLEQHLGLIPNGPVDVFDELSCPMKSRDKKRGKYFKFESPWSIQTPPGYSCLVMQPYYFYNQDVQILPAIIDTDKFDKKIPVIGFLTGKTEEVRFFCGDPLLHIIPFKRDDWEAEFTSEKILDKSKFFLYNAYKRIFHSPKSFK